jgi:hypothetical protein
MFRIVPAIERQAMNFGAQFWEAGRISRGDYRCQPGVFGAMVEAYPGLDLFFYRCGVSTQHGVGFERIECALVENRSFFSLAA